MDRMDHTDYTANTCEDCGADIPHRLPYPVDRERRITYCRAAVAWVCCRCVVAEEVA